MPTAFHVRALESIVRVELDETLTEAERESIASQWVDVSIGEDATANETILAGLGSSDEETPHGVTPVRAPSVEELSDLLASSVTLRGIGNLAGHALMLHAAAVSLEDGRVIGFVGPSGRGKTTAARVLGRRFGYVTDETLGVRADGSVIAYPKPLSIGDRPEYKQVSAASAVGLRKPVDELTLGAIVILDRRPDVDAPRIETVPLTEALADLVPQTSYFSALSRPLFTLVQLARSTGGIRRVVYSEAEHLPDLIDEILETTEDDDAMVTEVADQSRRDCDCAKGGGGDVPASSEAGTYRRTDHSDALLLDEQLLILRPSQITVLEGVGPVVWLAASDSTEADLREAALSQLPEPPEGVDPGQVVATTLQQLVEAQLLARR
jgi:energy-coupling factor transporter ATP-binding protein EcfA2